MLPLFTVLAVLSFCGGALAVPSGRAMEGEEPTDRLLGGDPLEGFGDFPFYVTLHGTYFWWPFPRYRCPALLYDRYTLITTAQCILSSWSTYSFTLTASCGSQSRGIRSTLMHPGVSFTSTDPFVPNDIGLMYVNIPFELTDDCQPAKLPDCSDARFPFNEVDVIGYNTNETDDTFNEPSKVTLMVLPLHYCWYHFGAAYHPAMHICLKDPQEQQAACFNDHSTPAILEDGTVIGMGSWIHRQCEDGNFTEPSVYVRLAHYVDWFQYHRGDTSD